VQVVVYVATLFVIFTLSKIFASPRRGASASALGAPRSA
jgi:hypothetical protein